MINNLGQHKQNNQSFSKSSDTSELRLFPLVISVDPNMENSLNLQYILCIQTFLLIPHAVRTVLKVYKKKKIN